MIYAINKILPTSCPYGIFTIFLDDMHDTVKQTLKHKISNQSSAFGKISPEKQFNRKSLGRFVPNISFSDTEQTCEFSFGVDLKEPHRRTTQQRTHQAGRRRLGRIEKRGMSGSYLLHSLNINSRFRSHQKCGNVYCLSRKSSYIHTKKKIKIKSNAHPFSRLILLFNEKTLLLQPRLL
jgi:hypothetical protein